MINNDLFRKIYDVYMDKDDRKVVFASTTSLGIDCFIVVDLNEENYNNIKVDFSDSNINIKLPMEKFWLSQKDSPRHWELIEKIEQKLGIIG